MSSWGQCAEHSTVQRNFPFDFGGSYRYKTSAHVGICHWKARFIDSLLEDQVNDSFQPLFGIYCQVCHLLHELIEHLGRQLVQDASYLAEQLLNDRKIVSLSTNQTGGFQEPARMHLKDERKNPIGTSRKLSYTQTHIGAQSSSSPNSATGYQRPRLWGRIFGNTQVLFSSMIQAQSPCCHPLK